MVVVIIAGQIHHCRRLVEDQSAVVAVDVDVDYPHDFQTMKKCDDGTVVMKMNFLSVKCCLNQLSQNHLIAIALDH